MTMGKAFLDAYSLLLIKTCHRRGAFAMGGMAAQIPVKGDPAANEAAFAKVRADKEREAGNGHDGTWVAHPDLVPVAHGGVRPADAAAQPARQAARGRARHRAPTCSRCTRASAPRTGLRENIRVGVQYIEAWLRGRGAVPLYNLMEDAATAEISRAQIWQWLHLKAQARRRPHGHAGPVPARCSTSEMDARERRRVGDKAYESGRFAEAIQLFSDMSLAREFEEFLTLPAYRLID